MTQRQPRRQGIQKDVLKIMGTFEPGTVFTLDEVAVQVGLNPRDIYRQARESARRLGLEVKMEGAVWRVPNVNAAPVYFELVKALPNGALLLTGEEGEVWWAKKLVDS